MELTENFKLSEFMSKDGAPFPEELMGNVKELAENLQVLRDYIDKPIIVNSGYRSPEHNKKVGGSPKSQHLLAKAADIRVNGMNPSAVSSAVLKLIREGKMKNGGVGLYNTFTHVDVRDTPARWDYRK